MKLKILKIELYFTIDLRAQLEQYYFAFLLSNMFVQRVRQHDRTEHDHSKGKLEHWEPQPERNQGFQSVAGQ
jgi:hypothetical protein